MSAPDRLPDEAIDGLLDGSPSEETAGTPLAAYLTELRNDAQATTPAPSSELGVVLAEGLDPAELEAASPSSDGRTRVGILGWRRRGRVLGRVLVTKFAALGLLGKAAAAGAAVTVAASGAGVTGMLPEPAQHAFDDAVGRQVQEAPADQGDAPDAAVDDAGTESETPPETPADTSTAPPLDTDVSDDATGSEDGEPGVDGEDVAEDASDGASRAPEDTPAESRPTEPPAGADRGDEAVEEAPSDATPSETPRAESGEVKQRHKGDSTPPAEPGGAQERSDSRSESSTTDSPRG